MRIWQTGVMHEMLERENGMEAEVEVEGVDG
jgi:hypothetical protein